uniref:Structural maintenance of chromosomes protein 5 n=1 Tax=Panagrolaimus sp. ES5 TaxID=591445 RepID=A0AC34GWG4_9BILA
MVEDTPAFQNEDYPRGSIRKLVFHDFLTYNHVECIPGPSMNVIVGPNGTGKSTIICGICLASGGSPKFLGRSDKLGDFIRHGKLEGYVEMFLKDDNEETGLRRFKILLRKPNNATYYINDKRVTHVEHTKAVEAYNIQVGNPCTFLAQDKVKSFAEQDSQLLLRNTEKAGTPELDELHTKLEEKQKEGNEMGGKKGELEAQLKKIRDDIARVRPLATSYLESQRRNQNINTFKAKKAFLIYDSNEKNYREKQQEAKAAHEVVKTFNTRKEAVQLRINDYKNLQKSLNIDRMATSFNTHRGQIMEKIRRLRQAFDADALANARREYHHMKSTCDNWEKQFAEVKALKTQFAQQYEELKANPPDKTELEQKESEWTTMRKELDREDQANESDYKAFLYKKREIENRKASVSQTLLRKVEQLSRWQKNENIVKAWDYYMKNKSQFKHPVYIPYAFIYTEDKYTKYLNNLIGSKDLGIFIFGCIEDERIIQDKFRNISSSVMTPQMAAQRSVGAELDPELEKLGFIDYACNIFTAPEPIKAYFNSVNFFDRTPVGDENTDRNCEAIAHQIKGRIQLFLTNKSRVNIIVSRYESGKVTVNRTPLKPDGSIGAMHTSKTRNIDENTDELDRKLEEVADRRTLLEGKKVEVERLRSTVSHLRQRYQQQSDNIKVAEEKLQKAERQEKRFGTEKPDLEKAKKNLEEIEKTAKQQIPRELANIVEAFGSLKKDANTHGINTIESKRYQALMELTQGEITEIDLQAQESTERYREIKTEEEQIRVSFLDARRDLKDIVGLSTTNPANLSKDEHKKIYEDLQKKFEEYKVPETVEECDNEIQQEEIRAQVGNLRGSKEDVKKLARLEKEETEVVAAVGRSDNVIQNWETDMKTLLDKWLKPLRELVVKISENFTNFFGKIGCSGEVRLAVPETNPLNINEYGIDIFVKFRSYNQLRRLTAQQQSGGERSVSTMLYLMALQELCPVPFRCVDEINQGMDPNNERLVFNMMVQLLSGTSGHLAHTQYFMLTPKLLPGLKFTPKVSVLMIHNSATMERGVHVLAIDQKQYELKVNS